MRGIWVAICLVCGMTALVGCDRVPKVALGDNVPTVPIAKPVQRLVSDFVDYTGRTNARDSVVIQPRVTGYLVTDDKEGTAFAFKEGDFVQKKQILFKIDPRPYQAQLDAVQSTVARDDAALKYARETNLRYKDIAKKQPDAVSPRELDQYKALEEQAIANLNLSKANLRAAELNLEWTTVRSPINGQISRYYLTPGNLVNQDVTQLTMVVSMDPMYVYFDMDEPTLLRIRKASSDGTIKPHRLPGETVPALAMTMVGLLGTPFSRDPYLAAATLIPGRSGPDAPVLIALAGEEFKADDKNRQGTINFIDNQVNPGTGSISVRGVFPNPRSASGAYLLAPGMFVRVRMFIGQPQEELLVIDRAITSDQGLKYIYVLDKDSKVEARRVTVGALQEDGLRVVTSGLQKDDWVLVGALQQVRPRMEIKQDKQDRLKEMPSLREAAVLIAEPKAKAKKK